jgi:hypothetical protein
LPVLSFVLILLLITGIINFASVVSFDFFIKLFAEAFLLWRDFVPGTIFYDWQFIFKEE